ncbi:hypothetical protein D3C75_595160 [compost metagenome]
MEVQGSLSLLHWVVFKNEECVEYRAGGKVRPASDEIERSIFMLSDLQIDVLQIMQPVHDGLLVGQTYAYRQGVDKEADHAFDVSDLTGAPGHDGAEHHIVNPCVATEQQCPCTLQNRVQCQLTRLSKLLHGRE